MVQLLMKSNLVVLQKAKHEIWPSNSTPKVLVYRPKEFKAGTGTNTYVSLFMEALFNNPKYSSMG